MAKSTLALMSLLASATGQDDATFAAAARATLARLDGLTTASSLREFWLARSFGVDVDTTCRNLGARPRPGTKRHAAMRDRRYGLEIALPFVVRDSRWFAARRANATLVVFAPRLAGVAALRDCRRELANAGRLSPKTWFFSGSSRGRCCNGGQLLDPSLLRTHFLTHAGDARDGPWLFRESRAHPTRGHDWRGAWRGAPDPDAGPKVRCNDDAFDVSVPTPAFVVGDDLARDAAEAPLGAEKSRVVSSPWIISPLRASPAVHLFPAPSLAHDPRRGHGDDATRRRG